MASGAIIIVIGGVRSGKTSWCENQAIHLSQKTNRRLVYIASGAAFDDEMKKRISRHKEDRIHFEWITIEQPVDLFSCTKKLHEGDIVLWDCVTTWLTNELILPRGNSEAWTDHTELARIYNELVHFVEWAKKHLHTCFIISNEVLGEDVFTEGLTAIYQQMTGELHQWLVTNSQAAIEMEAGLALVRKGEWQT
ncbi:bifunctional adenosylcobinamide kinase/adenosylcobinamide-phosphate guanylyltransferase [Jeotgalibacillus soli]|uniref:Adenosylcobinamide kinase n=1 Tax=Jeotgalibacillus soli TaxID=889306 RepID=A0A0C2VLC7_9BACL|nr:bifunctional adenosylcobinamide kinase/adenosylcobinamide-phosphate guanylyltransferase [Jeotgalibacillus soli]KIL49717.1 hypothetical protein KP78_11850 [Jeotgalibacillus soli]